MRKIFILFTLIFVTATSASFASINPDTIKVRLNSPRDAMLTHWRYLKEDSYFPKIAAKTLYVKNLPARKRKHAEQLAIQLKKIIQGKALIINFSSIPNNPDYIDSIDGRAVYYPFSNFKEIYLERIRKKWYYSEETVKLIPEIYDEIYPFTIETYVDDLPAFLLYKLPFQIRLWQIISLIILTLLVILLQKWLRSFVRFILRISFKNIDEHTVLTQHFRPVVRSLASIIALSIGALFLPILDLPVHIHIALVLAYRTITVILFTILAFRLTDYAYYRLRKYFEQKNKKIAFNMLPFFRTMFKTVLVILGILMIIVSLGFDIWPWLAGLSIGGLAIALAAQETIKNIFGSITILADRPFDVGDWIIYDNYEGTVEEIGIRSTTIRTFSDSLLTVPNGKLMDVTIDNMGLRHYRRFQTYLDIIYGTPVELIDAFVKGIEKLVEKHDFTRKDIYYIYLNNLAASSIQIFIRVWFTSKTWKDELRDRHIFIKDILELARTLGIEFAFPTQSLFIEHFPGASGNKEIQKPSQEEIDRKVDEFFKNKGV